MKEKKIDYIFIKMSLKMQTKTVLYPQELNILNDLKTEIRIYLMELVLTQFVFLFYKVMDSKNENSTNIIWSKFLTLLLFSARDRVLPYSQERDIDMTTLSWFMRILEIDQVRNLTLFISLYKMNLEKDAEVLQKNLLFYILETLLLKTTEILVYTLLLEKTSSSGLNSYFLKESLSLENKLDIMKDFLYLKTYYNILFYESKYIHYGIYSLIFTRGSRVLKKFFYSSHVSEINPTLKIQYFFISIFGALDLIIYSLKRHF